MSGPSHVPVRRKPRRARAAARAAPAMGVDASFRAPQPPRPLALRSSSGPTSWRRAFTPFSNSFQAFRLVASGVVLTTPPARGAAVTLLLTTAERIPGRSGRSGISGGGIGDGRELQIVDEGSLVAGGWKQNGGYRKETPSRSGGGYVVPPSRAQRCSFPHACSWSDADVRYRGIGIVPEGAFIRARMHVANAKSRPPRRRKPCLLRTPQQCAARTRRRLPPVR